MLFLGLVEKSERCRSKTADNALDCTDESTVRDHGVTLISPLFTLRVTKHQSNVSP